MKKLLLIILIGFWALSVRAQTQVYNRQTDFKFQPAKFEEALFDEYGVRGVFQNKLIIEADWDNQPTTMLVDLEGNIIYNFHQQYFLPDNYATDKGIWLVRQSGEPNNSEPDTVALAFFDMKSLTFKEKLFALSYYPFEYYSRGVIKGKWLKLNSSDGAINFINFENGIHKKISGPLYTQTDAVIDENAGLTYLLSAGCENSKCEISLYKSAIDKTPDITKSPLWTVSSSQIGLQGSPASIKFVSPKEFIIQGNYSDSAVVAKSFNLDGKLTSVFDISFQIRQEGFYPLGYSVHKFNNDWYLSGNNYGYWPLFYYKKESTIQVPFEGLLLPWSYETQNGLYANGKTGTVHFIDNETDKVSDIHYQIKKISKSEHPAFVLANADTTYWVGYANNYLVRYRGNKEIFRTDSLRNSYQPYSTFKAPDSSLWIPVNAEESIDMGLYKLYFNDFIRLGLDNSIRHIHSKEFFDEGKFMYYDKYRNQIYMLSDSLRRYDLNGKRDYTLNCQIPANKIGSVLVNSYGSIYLGNDPSGWPPHPSVPHTYRLGHNGEIKTLDVLPKTQLGWHGNYTNNNFNYPYFEKEDMVLWGHLECGEGCYTYESFAISESDEKINIKYIERVPGEINYKQSGGYVKDAYGLTLRNQRIFMKYDSTQKTFYEDPKMRISFSGYVGSVDILPGGDIIATDFNTVNLYSLKTDSSLVTRITNLENVPNDFFKRTVKQAGTNQIPLKIKVSNGSQAETCLEPADTRAAKLFDTLLIFQNTAGNFKVISQSVEGGVPFVSQSFEIRKENIEPIPDISPLQLTKPKPFSFKEPEYFYVKIDSVEGSCTHENLLISGTGPGTCTVYYSWPENNFYLAGQGETQLQVIDVLLGTAEPSNESILTYPNPSESNSFEILAPRKISNILVFNFLGQEVHPSLNINGNQATLKLNSVESGIYFLQVFDQNNQSLGNVKQVVR